MYKNIKQLYKAQITNIILFRYSYVKIAGSAVNRHLFAYQVNPSLHQPPERAVFSLESGAQLFMSNIWREIGSPKWQT